MNSCGTCRECNYSFVLTYKFFKVFFKTIHIRAKRNNPIGIKSFLNKFLLVAGKVAQAKKDSIFSFFHNIITFSDLNSFLFLRVQSSG